MTVSTLMVPANTKSVTSAYPNIREVTVTFPLSGLTKMTAFFIHAKATDGGIAVVRQSTENVLSAFITHEGSVTNSHA